MNSVEMLGLGFLLDMDGTVERRRSGEILHFGVMDYDVFIWKGQTEIIFYARANYPVILIANKIII